MLLKRKKKRESCAINNSNFYLYNVCFAILEIKNTFGRNEMLNLLEKEITKRFCRFE